MIKMRAAVTPDKGLPFVIENVELQDPQEDEVLVKVAASGICHTDVAGQMQVFPVGMPAVLGHEGAGIVEKVGSAVKDLAVGDHVAMTFGSCGECPSCRNNKPYACANFRKVNFMGTMPDGTKRMRLNGSEVSSFFSQSSFAAYSIVRASSAVKIDPEVDLAVAAPFGCGIQTGAGIVINSLKAGFGDNLAVFGCGTVGMSALMAARIVGCENIIAVGGNDKSLELALEIGATHAINRKKVDDVAEEIKKICPGGVDYAIDTSGVTSMMETALASLCYTGTLVGAGVGFELPLLQRNLGLRRIYGVCEGDSVPKYFIPKLINYYKQGRLPVDKIMKFYPFDEINEAFEDSHSGKVIKAVLKME